LILIKKRPDFLHAAENGCKIVKSGFVLQAVATRRKFDPPVIRAGFTASKKVGNAVCRNRARRRLRPLCAEFLPVLGIAGYDYVVIARSAVLNRPWHKLRREFQQALTEAAEEINHERESAG